ACATAKVEWSEADSTGSIARDESRMRRSITGKRMIGFMLLPSRCRAGAQERGAPAIDQSKLGYYLPTAARAASIFAFTASRLKLAPLCIGGNSIAVIASFSTACWTNTKRQNSYLNHWKYSCDPDAVPLSGQPVRSNGSRRRLIR